MKKFEEAIYELGDKISLKAIQEIRTYAKENFGKEIEIVSLYPDFEFEVVNNDEKIAHSNAFKKNKHFKEFKGREEYCLHCHDYGMKSYEYGKVVEIDGKEFKIVGFCENMCAGYYLLMGKRGGLYVSKAK